MSFSLGWRILLDLLNNKSLKYFISNSGKVLLTGLACQTLLSRALVSPVVSDNSTALNVYSADNLSAIPAVAWIENSIKPESFTQLIWNVSHFEPIHEQFDGDSASRPGSRVKRASNTERRRKRLATIRSNLINNDVCLINSKRSTMGVLQFPPKFRYFSLATDGRGRANIFFKKFEYSANIPLSEQLADGRWAFRVYGDKNTTFSIQHVNTCEYLCLHFYSEPFAFFTIKVRLMRRLSKACQWQVILHPGEKLSITLQDLKGRTLGGDSSEAISKSRRPAYVERNRVGSRWQVKMCNPEDLENAYDVKDLDDLKGLGASGTNRAVMLLNKSEAVAVSYSFSVGTVSSFAGTGLICYFLMMYALFYRKVYKDEKKRLKNTSRLQYQEDQAMVNEPLGSCRPNEETIPSTVSDQASVALLLNNVDAASRAAPKELYSAHFKTRIF